MFELPRDVENGRLSWLAGFSSGLTEVIYLGKAWSDPERRVNNRIEFFERNGFTQAAADYRAFSYPEELTEHQRMMARLAPRHWH